MGYEEMRVNSKLVVICGFLLVSSGCKGSDSAAEPDGGDADLDTVDGGDADFDVSDSGDADLDTADGGDAEPDGVDGGDADLDAIDGGDADLEEPEAYLYFAINTHDFLHIEESADTLLRLIDMFERHGARGDFYLTAPMVQFYEESRPDVLTRLRESTQTISHHLRPPHPLYGGFGNHLRDLNREELEGEIRDYETYRLDMATGELLRDEPGGYSYMTDTFGRAPTIAVVPDARWRDVAFPIFAELGARMTVTYHEGETDPDEPFEWESGLLVRPSDLGVTQWSVPELDGDRFWWNMLTGPHADSYNPTAHLRAQIDSWEGDRPPFATVLIHENNFYRMRHTPWALIYYEDREKTRPRSPPFDLGTPDASEPRPVEDREAIWAAYEELIEYGVEHHRIVTSEDILELASD